MISPLLSIWKRNRKTIIPILIVALLLRLAVLAATTPYTTELNDQKIFEIATEYLFDGKDLYAADIEQTETPFRTQLIRNYPYGPFPTWIFAALTMIGEMVHVKFGILLRLLNIGVDLLLTFLIFVTAIRLKLDAKLLGWLYALNPLTIIITAYHGQLDVLTIFFAFLAVYVLLFSGNDKKHIGAGLLLGVSIAIKMFTILLWPWFIARLKGWKKRVLFTILAGLPFALSFLTVLTSENVGHAIRQVLLYGGAGAESGIILTLKVVGMERIASLYHVAGKYILLLAVCAAAVLFWRRLSLMEGMALSFLIAMVVAPTMGVQYFVWFLPFYLLSGFFRLRQFLIQLGILTITMGLFYLYHAIGIGALAAIGLMPDMRPSFIIAFKVFMWLAWAGFWWLTVDALRTITARTKKLHA